MGTYTENLNLYNTNMLTDGNDTFDFQRDLNDNNNKIDAFAGQVNANKANIDLNNLSNDGQAILDNKLNKQQITNCLTEIPQKIKLELNEGVLTLKAGSKVIVPNGFESDGVTPKFDEVEVESDLNATSTNNSTIIIFVNYDRLLQLALADRFTSGATPPTATNWQFWYDTTNNIIKEYNQGSLFQSGDSLPIAICTANGTQISSIDQVFNGIGYIGSTVWVDKGVKGLIPDGRNADGSLKNIEYTTPTVLTRTWTTQSYNYNIYIFEDNTFIYAQPRNMLTVNNYGELPVLTSGDSVLAYIKDENTCYESTSRTNYKWVAPANGNFVVIGNVDIESGKVTKLTPVNTFRAIDYSDQNLPQVDGQWVYKALTLTTVATAGSETFDLKANNYLPNDNYTYEVLASVYGYQNSSATNTYGTIKSDIISNNGYVQIGLDNGVVTSNVPIKQSAPLPVNRTITVLRDNPFTSFGSALYGYRRLGTNN